jgi:hypothetical protein
VLLIAIHDKWKRKGIIASKTMKKKVVIRIRRPRWGPILLLKFSVSMAAPLVLSNSNWLVRALPSQF